MLPKTWEEYDHWYLRELIKTYMAGFFVLTAVVFGLLLVTGCSVAGADNTVAKVIAAEACGEGELGMRAVASVIQNRAVHHRKTPLEIVTAKNQFFGYTAVNRDRLYLSCKVTADKIAAELEAGVLADIVDGAEYFLLETEPLRRWHGEKTVVIKHHTFYREANREVKK